MSSEIPDKEARVMGIETIPYDTSEITLISIESQKNFIDDVDITPVDWREQIVASAVTNEHVVVEYFPPEIEQNMAWVPQPIKRIVDYEVNKHMEVYNFIADWAASVGRTVRSAEIATMFRFLLFESGLDLLFKDNREKIYSVKPQPGEQSWVTSTTARRLFTARALMQLAESHPDGTSIIYVAAPAHVNRVKNFILAGKTPKRDEQARLYNRVFWPLDRNIRTFEYDGRGWNLCGLERIR